MECANNSSLVPILEVLVFLKWRQSVCKEFAAVIVELRTNMLGQVLYWFRL